MFERQADVSDDWRQTENGYTYGLYGTPTVLELGARIAEIEGAHHTFVVPGGQAAISLIYLAFCKSRHVMRWSRTRRTDRIASSPLCC